MLRRAVWGCGLAILALSSSAAFPADKKYGPGVTVTEIKVGQFAAIAPAVELLGQNKAASPST